MNAAPHRRRNLLTGDWVLVSPHRLSRPWQGDDSPPADNGLPAHDPGCYLCPGNLRSTGVRNAEYSGVFAFDNDFPALLETAGDSGPVESPFETLQVTGTAQVICYGPEHNLTLADLGPDRIADVVRLWAERSADLGERFGHVQIFENKGAMMGCSSPHPHGQIWASDFVPSEVTREDDRQRQWRAAHGTVLLDAVAAAELSGGDRVVVSNDHWLAVIPYWASWPFETLIVARDPVARLEQLGEDARMALARLLDTLLRGYDALFGVSFPYSMGWHGAPHALGSDTAHWRLHAHVYPPLLRSASVRKFMVGFELLGEAQRDLTPEVAAERLRAVIA